MRAIYSVAIMATAVTVLDNATVAGRLFSNTATATVETGSTITVPAS